MLLNYCLCIKTVVNLSLVSSRLNVEVQKCRPRQSGSDPSVNFVDLCLVVSHVRMWYL